MKTLPLPSKNEATRLLRLIADAPPASPAPFPGGPLALYGAGDLGKMAKAYFDRLGIPISFVADARAEAAAAEEFWKSTRLIPPGGATPEELENTALAVTIATLPYCEIESFLKAYGWKNIYAFYDLAENFRDRHPLSNGWYAGKLDAGTVKNIENILVRWDDDVSRAHHLQFLAWRCLRRDWAFEGAAVNTKNRYFIPEILSVLKSGESFADIGAHVGAVSQKFIDAVKGEFDRVWAVEPDRANLEKLAAWRSTLPPGLRARVEILETLLSSAPRDVRFFDDAGYASQSSPIGSRIIKADTVDGLGIAPTFIKLHLEGYELEVLKGARNAINALRPIITATSYHNSLGLWELPAWLMENLKDYRHFMRLHSFCGTGSVVYSIPRERFG